MLKNSGQFPQHKYNQSSKSVKFAFNDTTSPNKVNPSTAEKNNKSFRTDLINQMHAKNQSRISPQRTLPAHNVAKASSDKGIIQASPVKPFENPGYNFGNQEPVNSLSQSSGTMSAARLQDLCPEDKQKIGELIKKLAQEKEEKEKLRKELEQKEVNYKSMVENLAKENDQVVQDSLDLQSQFRYSLNLLKSFQETTSKQQQKIKQQQLLQQSEIEYKPQPLERTQSPPHNLQGHLSQHTSPQRGPQQLQYINSGQKFGSANNTVQYPGLSLSFLNSSKEEYSKINDENFHSGEQDGGRRLLMQEPGRTQQMFLQERINQESQLTRSGQKETIQEVMNREEHTVSEIVRLKEDIEGLTHSLKRINFTSPSKIDSTLKGDDLMRSLPPTQEQRAPSPMKLVQDYQQESMRQSGGRFYQQQHQDEESYYRDQNMNRSLEKPPIFKKGAQPQVSKASAGKYQQQQENNGSSSEDDEMAIAQKWLNLRKQKIQKINDELNEGKAPSPLAQQQPQRGLHESQRSEEPRKPNKLPLKGSPPRRFEDEGDDVYQEEIQHQRQLQLQQQLQQQIANQRIPKAGLEDLNEEDLRAINRDWIKNSPQVRGVSASAGLRSDGFTSGQKVQLDTNDFFKKRATGSASKSLSLNLGSPQRAGGLVDINTMNMEELIQLKSVLDQRLGGVSSSENTGGYQQQQQQPNRLEFSLGSGIKNFDKSQLSFISPTSQDFFEQPTYADTTKSTSSLQYSANREGFHQGGNNMPQQNYNMRNNGSYERRGEYIDPSLMRDFDSIAYTHQQQQHQPQRQIQSPIKILGSEGIPSYPTTHQKQVAHSEEEDSRSDVDHNLYEQKLQEFLRVRERMLKTNKIREQGLQIEDLLKNTLIDSKRSNTSQSASIAGPTRFAQNQYINSPPSVKSVGRAENARFSDREREAITYQEMLNQDLMRQALQENMPMFAHKRTSSKEDSFFKAKKLDSEAKTPDYGYGRSQASSKSLKYQESESEELEEVAQLTDDFYDDKLFDLVEDIDHRESSKSTPAESFRKSELNTATSRPRTTEVDHEFNNLFNTVRTMLSHNDPHDATTTDRIRDKFLNKYDKSELILSKLSSDDEHDHDADFSQNISHTQHTIRSVITDNDRSRRPSDLVIGHHPHHHVHGRPSKTDSSIIETDTSVLAINKKINDMRKNKKFWKS